MLGPITIITKVCLRAFSTLAGQQEPVTKVTTKALSIFSAVQAQKFPTHNLNLERLSPKREADEKRAYDAAWTIARRVVAAGGK